MDMRSPQKAMDCVSGSMDWVTLGTRILQVAGQAGAIHLQQADAIYQDTFSDSPGSRIRMTVRGDRVKWNSVRDNHG